MTVIVTKNSSTASAVPTTSDLVQGELAVNVTDKRIFTENASTQIVELGTNPSTITTATATVTGTLTANGTFASSNAVLTGGTVNGVVIGGSTPLAITGTTVTANTGFVGGLTGNVTGNLTGNVTGNVTGDLTGNVTGNLTASTGTTTLNNLVVNGTADFTNTKLVNVTTPTAGTDAANKDYVDTSVAAVIDAAPAALDTLNELAAALGDDANFSSTITTSIATKLPLAGGTMTGAIEMGTSKITGLGDPTANQDAATKNYVDTQDATKLSTTGGTMSGAIAMGTNKITGLGDPTLAQDAATKAYTDSILGSATSAATSATAAANSASAAASSASAASTSETNAATSASASASSASEAATSYDNFDDRYLGQKASDPALDNDGDALLTGAIYFNTTDDKMKVYTGSAWVDVAPVATSVTVSQISDLTATAAELNYVDGVTSNIQTQIDNIDALPSQTDNAGKFLTTDGTDASWDDVSGVIVDEQTFTTSGTWTKPDNASFVCVQLIGGGGGGAAGNFAGDGASGGGGGAFVERIFPASSVGATETITIAAGGSGNTGGGNGTDGGTSSFGSLVDALGGRGGTRSNTSTRGLPYSTGNVDSTISRGAPASYAGYGGMATIDGGDTIYGGAGGAGAKSSIKTGGVSVFGGNGGDSALSGSAGNGTQPGGGGGGLSNGGSGSGGNGAAGNARIISW